MNEEPLTQIEVERMIAQDISKLEGITREYRDALREEAIAEANHKEAYSNAYLNADGAVETRKAIAEKETYELNKSKLLATARAKALYQYLFTIRGRIEGLRSLNSNIRAQV